MINVFLLGSIIPILASSPTTNFSLVPTHASVMDQTVMQELSTE